MPFTEKIVGFINEQLKASSLNDKRFQPGNFLGIATQLARPSKSGQGLELLPATCDDLGVYRLIEPDDKFPIAIYHRSISTAYTRVKGEGYGDGYLSKDTVEMQIVVLADQRKIKVNQEQLESICRFGIPDRLSSLIQSALALRTCLVTPLSSNMDRVMVFRQEYPGTEFFLKPHHILFSIRYRIETTFDKNCIDRCLCGE
jgi:hypothetical protein